MGFSFKAPKAKGSDTRGKSELESESDIHAQDAALESDEDGDEHPFHGFHKEFLKGDPRTARDAFRGMMSTVEDDDGGSDAPSLLEAFRGRNK